MNRDPILREVREARERHAAQFNFDLKAIFADLKRTEQRRGSKVLEPPPKGEALPNPALQRTRFARR